MKPEEACVIYQRVSSKGQIKGTSLNAQKNSNTETAERNNLTVVASFEDVHTGADYAERVGLLAALDVIERGQAKTLIIANFDRYSRDREHQEAIRKRLRLVGGKLLFGNIHFEDTPEGDLQFGIMGSFAQYERMRIRARVMSGMREKAKQGKQPSRAMRPFGFLIVNKPLVMAGKFKQEQLGDYIHVESEAYWMQRAFEEIDSGASLRTLSRLLEGAGVPTVRGGKRWYASVLRGMLTNPVYKGKATFGRHQTLSDETRPEKGLGKIYHVEKPQSEWIFIDVPPIVDEALWNRVQHRLATGRQERSGNPSRKYMLSGLMRCPVCGRRMGGKCIGGRNYKEFKERADRGESLPNDYYYRCAASYEGNEKGYCPNSKSYYMGDTDTAIVRQVLAAAKHPTLLAEIYEEDRKTAEKKLSKKTLSSLRAEHKKTCDEIEVTIEAQLRAIKSNVSSAVYERRLGEFEAKKKELEREILEKESEFQNRTSGNPASKAKAMQAIIKGAEKALKSPDISNAEKHDLLTVIIDKIIPQADGTFFIQYKSPKQ